MKKLIALSVLTAVHLVHAVEIQTVSVNHAAEIEFETQRGHYYQIQASTNSVDWADAGERVYGDGHRAQQVFAGGSTQTIFRVALTDAPTNGLAPASFAGLTLSLDDLPGGNLMQFLTETNGTDLGVNPDVFNYALTLLSPNQAEADVNYAGNKRDLYTFTFTANGAGAWSRDEYRNGLFSDRDTGTFRVTAGLANLPLPPALATNAIPATPPTVLTRLTYIFLAGESPDSLQFLTATNGLEAEDNFTGLDNKTNKLFSYTYSLVKSNAATLVVTFSATRRDEYALTFTVGAQGSFIRREFRNGALDDTDTGSFSPSALALTNLPVVVVTNNPVTTNPPPVIVTNTPVASPSTVSSQKFTFTEVGSPSVPVVTTFLSSAFGSQTDDSAPSTFNYTYTKTGPTTANMTINFKLGKWDTYEINFTAVNGGTFTRREYRNFLLNDTDTGTFTRNTP